MTIQAPKVLVVDDDFELREEIVDLLIQAGFDAHSAKDGREGLHDARLLGPFAAIVLDIGMPMLDGPTFRAIQQSDAQLARIPVIVLSADHEARRVALDLGAHAFISKPFAPEALIEALRECCLPLAGAAAE